VGFGVRTDLVMNSEQYYPGDEYVDWWAISLFHKKNFKDKYMLNFIEDAKKHKKPVILRKEKIF
jgi:beta-mannanase